MSTPLSFIEPIGIAACTEPFLCRITVLKKAFDEELYRLHPYGEASSCTILTMGQEFISTNRWLPPEGFCPWAWSELRPLIQSFHSGRTTVSISCCTDGLRPVTFKLESVAIL